MSSIKYLNTVGSFECVVVKPEAGWIGEQGEKQSPFVRIPLVITDGANKGEVAIYKAWLTAGAFDNTIKRLAEVFQFDGDLSTLHAGKQTLEGKPCNITTEMETYEGKDRLKIAWLNPPGGGAVKPLDEAKVSSILSKLTAKGKAIAKSVNGAAKPLAASQEKSFEEMVDDIPT